MNKVLASLIRIAGAVAAVGVIAVACCTLWQRSLLFYPSHNAAATLLTPWKMDGVMLGYVKLTDKPEAVWLMLHGNGGQASERDTALGCFPPGDSVYFLEYPGYGFRAGSPSRKSMNAAANEGYQELRRLYPNTPICALGESIGSGPASYLCSLPHPPDKLVLVVPFDELASVAAEALPFLPVRLMLFDRWDNREALRNYPGPIEIFGAREDDVIPVKHATNLAAGLPRAKFHQIAGGHNDWSHGEKVRFTSR